MNPCFNLNVLMLSLEHVLPYKFFSFYLHNSEIHYNQTIINIFKYIYISQDIILNKHTSNIISTLQYITGYHGILWQVGQPMANTKVI